MAKARPFCATDGCYQRATERFEYGGVGSNYCADCMAKINALAATPAASEAVGRVGVKRIADAIKALRLRTQPRMRPRWDVEIAEDTARDKALWAEAADIIEALTAPTAPSRETVIEEVLAAVERVRQMLGQAGGTGIAGVQNSITEREVGGWVLDAVSDELAALKPTGEKP